jgi:hypothetical protein
MAIPTSGSVAVDIPAGIQTEFRIVDAEFDEQNRYGPSIELELELTDEKYIGTSIKYWAKVQCPRLDKVRKLREEGLDDETIAAALNKQGFTFDSIDEADTYHVARAGKLYAILSAVEGSAKGAETALKKCANFSELAEGLIDGSFVGTTSRTADDKYAKLDGKEAVFAVASPVATAEKPEKVAATTAAWVAEEDAAFDDIPF